jgi:hypothetical protein
MGIRIAESIEGRYENPECAWKPTNLVGGRTRERVSEVIIFDMLLAFPEY